MSAATTPALTPNRGFEMPAFGLGVPSIVAAAARAATLELTPRKEAE